MKTTSADTGLIALTVNGQPARSAAQTVADLVSEHTLAAVKVATAVNGRFIAEQRRATTKLEPGDRVEIVSARQGG